MLAKILQAFAQRIRSSAQALGPFRFLVVAAFIGVFVLTGTYLVWRADRDPEGVQGVVAMVRLAAKYDTQRVPFRAFWPGMDEWRGMNPNTARFLVKDERQEAVSALEELLADDDFAVRRVAAIMLRHIGPPEAEAAIPALMTAMNDEFVTVRLQAACTLIGMAGSPALSLDAVATQLASLHQDVSWSAALLFMAMEPPPDVAAEQFGLLLGRYWPHLREVGARGFAMLGPAADPYIPQLVDLLDDPDADVRLTAAEILWSSRVSDIPIPDIVAAMAEGDRDTRAVALRALASLGSSAETALPALVELLGDHRRPVREAAADAIGAIDRDAALAVFLELLAEGDFDQRRIAIRILAETAPGDPGIVAALRQAANDTDAYVRSDANDALEAMEGEAERETRPASAGATGGLHGSTRRCPVADLLVPETSGSGVPPVTVKWLREIPARLRAVQPMPAT